MRRYRDCLFPVLLLLTLCCCSLTTVKGTWVNPAYQEKKFRKILVMGISENETYRRIFEDLLSAKLRAKGVAAEPAYILFEMENRPDRETISNEIAAQGFDALIVSKVTGKRTEKSVHAQVPYYGTSPYGWYDPYYRYTPAARDWYWYDYYYRSYDLLHGPAYVTSYEVVTVESNLYDTENDELVWSAISETVVEEEMTGTIGSLVETLMEKLEEARLL